MNRLEMNYLTAKDLPNFIGSEVWVQKKPAMISSGHEMVVFGKTFLGLTLLDVDFARNHLVLQGYEGRVEIVPLSQCAVILGYENKIDRATGAEDLLLRGRVGLTN
jgi:hypothetical protein